MVLSLWYSKDCVLAYKGLRKTVLWIVQSETEGMKPGCKASLVKGDKSQSKLLQEVG